MDILGISCYFHDASAALLRDGVLVAAAEEERFSRVKHDYRFPRLAIQFCLEQGGIRGEELDYVVFFEKPFVKFERILLSVLQTFPRSRKVFQESMISWMTDKLWIKDLIKHTFGLPDDRLLFTDHHLAHASSSFFCSPFREAGILTVDGVGEWATTTFGTGKGSEIRVDREITFPHSLGMLYSAFTAFLGFEVNEGEYKVMGMAPFGTPTYVDEIYRLIHVERDGSFRLNLDYFAYPYSTDMTYTNRFLDLFGPPRDPGRPFFTATSGFPSYFGTRPFDFDQLACDNQRYANIAASIQHVTEETLLRMARHLHRETGLTQLCMAGGVALNSVANGRILRETPFDEIYIQPSAGDGGGALGAALWAHHMVLGHPRSFVLDHAFWGKAHGPREIEDFLRRERIRYISVEDTDKLVDLVVEEIQQGSVLGWFQDRFEWGPRALGHRSILADPRQAAMKDIVNTKIKFREPFRPFAPSVVEEAASTYFALSEPARHYPARFMLYVVDVNEPYREVLPAITHVDGTARLQTVSQPSNPLYFRLIQRFGEATGVPVVLNTSFNLKGEPIVNTPEEAFQTFRRSDMDLLVLGHCLIRKER